MRIIKKLSLCAFFAVLISSVPVFSQEKPDALKLYNTGKYKEAIDVCEAELAKNPKNMDSYTVLGWSLIQSRRYAEAEKRSSDGLKISSTDVRVIEILGEAKYYQGKNKEALEQFEKYVSLTADKGPRIGAAYYYMGEIYVRLAKYQHADISLSAAVRKEPLRDFWWARLGYAREMAKDYSGASSAYDHSLSLNPAQTNASLGKQRIAPHL